MSHQYNLDGEFGMEVFGIDSGDDVDTRLRLQQARYDKFFREHPDATLDEFLTDSSNLP